MPALGKELQIKEYDQIAVLNKSESTYSDDSLPAAADAVIMTGRPTLSILGDEISHDYAKPYWGQDPHNLVNRFLQLSGEAEIAGAGSAGSLPGLATLLRACGLAETQNVGVDVQYDPASENLESSSLYFYEQDDLWKMVGVRGDVNLQMNAGAFPKWAFTLNGLFQLPSGGATEPTIPASTDAEAKVLNFDNTPTATLFGETVDISSFSMNQGNRVTMIDRPGQYAVKLTGRQPSGSVTISAPKLTVMDFYAEASAHSTGQLQVQHGVDAGEIFQVDIGKAQIKLGEMTTSDLGENEMGLTLPFSVLPTSGDDDFKYTFK